MTESKDWREFDTGRLSLRVPALADFGDSAAMWGDESVVRYIGGRPFTREESWLRFLRYVGHWQLFNFGFWVVREKVGGNFVGEIGLGDFRREITPDFRNAPEIGWVLASSAHGNGFATEAARAALGWMERRHQTPRIVCMIEHGNSASQRVAAKCGFREFANTTYKSAAVALFERAATEPAQR